MQSSDDRESEERVATNLQWLWGIAAAIGLVFAALVYLCPQFNYETEFRSRPILTMLALFGLATILYLVSLRFAIRLPQGKHLVAAVWIPAIIYRMMFLPTTPIQEIDLYRYMWDGISVCEGVSPYRYSPSQSALAISGADMPRDLRTLVDARDRSPSRKLILQRIHFGELRTVYPPVSQLVFAAAMWLTPEEATVPVHRLMLKTAMVVMDLATLLCVWLLLPRIGIHQGFAIVYGWCPLLLKEVANSGHLDAITVALTAWAVLLLVNSVSRKATSSWRLPMSVGFLAVGTAAKLFPVILAPIWFAVAWKHRGLPTALATMIGYCGLSALLLWPMFDPGKPTAVDASEMPDARELEALEANEMPPHMAPAVGPGDGLAMPPIPEPYRDSEPEPVRVPEPQRAPSGLKEFLSRWEMNDAVFGFVSENIRPPRPGYPQKWYAFVPVGVRSAIADPVAQWLDVQPHTAAFMITRAASLIVTGLLILVVAIRIDLDRPKTIVTAVALSLAWFFLLSPTLNPWYWTWTLPFVVALRNRVWLILPGILLVYYFRFSCAYENRHVDFGGTVISGNELFDTVVVFIEWSVFFGLLIATSIFRIRLADSEALPSQK